LLKKKNNELQMIRNIKISRKLWISAFTLMLIAPSCSLDIEETDSVLTKGESAVFNGVANPGSYLETIYANIRGEAGDQANLYALTEVTTDELVVPTRGTDWGDNGVWRTLHQHTWSTTHEYILNVWNNKNGGILRASEVLDPLTTTATTEQQGHAHFTRAYNMWIIMDFFGQVPFRKPSDANEVIPEVMTRGEAYDMVVEDLTAAIEKLPATAATKQQAVKATARFFLAKVKLNANIYKGAYGATDLQDVIDLVDAIEADGYTLTTDYFDIFAHPFTNADVIWAVDACACNRMWNGLHYNQTTPDNGGGGWNGFTTLAEFYDKFEGPENENVIGGPQEERRGFTQTLETTTKQNSGFGYGFQIGQMYGWKYEGKQGEDAPAPVKDDAGNWIDEEGYATALKDRQGNPLVLTKELPGLVGNNELTGIRLLKYSPADGTWRGGVVMARYGDAHLMRAEAIFRSGDDATALAEINELRAMRDNTPALAGPLTEQIILDERARELYTEGWRRNDLIRFGQFKNAWEFKEASDGHTDLFPIPASALLSNPGLVQNPGY
jgi:starch-binding outer membrane protein, SusD/RagB family